MSRYEFEGKDGATKVAVGYDRPLKTFFVQVFRPDPNLDGEEVAFIWKGCDAYEIPNAAEAISIAQPYADLPADLNTKLETDRLKSLGTMDGPAQRAAQRFTFRRPGH